MLVTRMGIEVGETEQAVMRSGWVGVAENPEGDESLSCFEKALSKLLVCEITHCDRSQNSSNRQNRHYLKYGKTFLCIFCIAHI